MSITSTHLPHSIHRTSNSKYQESSDILDSRRRVHLQLATTLADEELDGCKVALVDLHVFFELGPKRNSLLDKRKEKKYRVLTIIRKRSRTEQRPQNDSVSP